MSVFRGVCTICGASCWGRPLTEKEAKMPFVCSSCKAEHAEKVKKLDNNRVLTLSRRVDELLSENQKLRENSHDMSKCPNCDACHKNLSTDNDRLRKENEKLRAEVDSLRVHNTELVDHIARLERFIDDSIADARRKVLEATDD